VKSRRPENLVGAAVPPIPKLDLRSRTRSSSSGANSDSRLGKRSRESKEMKKNDSVEVQVKAPTVKKRRLRVTADDPFGAPAHSPAINQEVGEVNENVIGAARDVSRVREVMPTHGKAKLDGFAVELDCIPVNPEERSRMFTWERLMGILLRTGRKRVEERRTRDAAVDHAE